MLFIFLGILSFYSSAQNLTCRIDTTLIYNYVTATNIKEINKRIISTYNSSNLKIEDLEQRWNPGANQWENHEKLSWAYNQANKPVEQLTRLWSKSSSSWQNYYRTVWFYNTKNLLIGEMLQFWNSSNTWDTSERKIWYYDASDREVEFILQTLDYLYFRLLNKRKVISSYNSNNLIDEQIIYEWDQTNSQWYRNMKRNWTYNASNIEYLISYWNNLSNSWRPGFKIVNSFNASNKKSEEITYSWDNNTNQWNNVEKKDYLYSGLGYLIEMLERKWKSSVSSWVNYAKENWNYNTAGLETENLRQVWDETNNVWVNYTKQNKEYDANNVLIAYELATNWTTTGNYFIDRERREYKCSLLSTDLNNITEEKFKVFPNPVSENILHIVSEKSGITLSISDAQGKVLYTTTLNEGDNLVNLSNFAPGIYLIQSGTSTRKILKF
ncbi:MAG: T9SS type A sorting domain-containing protein [Chitinophagales bacterium]|nr:T9SS type A sorting domain-containing protein [Chitinophagales bacterium]